MVIEGISIRNFKTLKKIDLKDLPALAVFVGKNGVGKTTLFRVFTFLKNCLSSNVRVALQDEDGIPLVRREILRYKRTAFGAPFHFIDFSRGQGLAVSNEVDFDKPDAELTRESQAVDPEVLAISSLGQLERFKAARTFRGLIENWHISDFHINDARGRKTLEQGYHLSPSGDNLPSRCPAPQGKAS